MLGQGMLLSSLTPFRVPPAPLLAELLLGAGTVPGAGMEQREAAAVSILGRFKASGGGRW